MVAQLRKQAWTHLHTKQKPSYGPYGASAVKRSKTRMVSLEEIEIHISQKRNSDGGRCRELSWNICGAGSQSCCETAGSGSCMRQRSS